jgi:hypothetical protein
MDRSRVLAAVSAVQLSAGITGMVIALRRNHPYHVPLLHGRPEKVVRDSVVMGTALSAPVVMLGTQAVATTRVLRGGTERARQVLGVLGATMVVGYLAEQLVRRRLRPSGWDPVESPLVLVGIGSAAAMAALEFTARRA